MFKKTCLISYYLCVFFLLKVNIVFANVEVGTYCNNIISQDLLHKIDNTKPQFIEIKIDKYRKWQINKFRLAIDLAKQGVHGSIYEKYKKKFNATVHVKFDDKIKCSFRAKIRQHGDFADHTKLIDGNRPTKSSIIYKVTATELAKFSDNARRFYNSFSNLVAIGNVVDRNNACCHCFKRL